MHVSRTHRKSAKFFRRPGKPGEDRTLYKLADTALSAALGPGFGKDRGGSWLIGWADTPAAPLSLEEEAPRLQNVTLIVMRVPEARLAALRSVATRLGANARLTSAERFMGSGGEVRARLYNYQCDFENMNKIPAEVKIIVSGLLTMDNDYPNGITADFRRVVKAGRAARLEIWSASAGTWQQVPAHWSGKMAVHQKWSLKATLRPPFPASVIRRPDNVMQFRIRTGNGLVRVGAVQVIPAP